MLEPFLKPYKILERLVATKKPCTIVADPEIIEAIRSQLNSEGALLLPLDKIMKGQNFTPQSGPYFVATYQSEHLVKRRLRAYLAARGLFPEIYGVLHDLAAMSVSEAPMPLAGGLESAYEALKTQPAFAILCGPRSGSQHLARELFNNGLGQPLEHMRPPVIDLMRERPGGFDFVHWLASVVRYGARNGVFGTKLISHFLRDVYSFATPVEAAALTEFLSRIPVIYLLRTNKLMQALSRDRAKATGNYHLFDESKRETYKKSSEAWNYDFERIKKEVIALADEETFLHKMMLDRIGKANIKIAEYEALDIPDIIAHLESALGRRAMPASERLSTNILRDEITMDYAKRFMNEYAKSYKARSQNTHIPLKVWVDAETLALKTSGKPDLATAG